MVKNLLANARDMRDAVRSLGREDPLERKWQPTPVFLPGESHGPRSLVGYSPRGHKELDTTEQLHFSLVAQLVVPGSLTDLFLLNFVDTELPTQSRNFFSYWKMS